MKESNIIIFATGAIATHIALGGTMLTFEYSFYTAPNRSLCTYIPDLQ